MKQDDLLVADNDQNIDEPEVTGACGNTQLIYIYDDLELLLNGVPQVLAFMNLADIIGFDCCYLAGDAY